MILFGIIVLHCVGLGLTATAESDYDPVLHNEYHLFTRLNPTVSQPLVMGLPGLLATSNFDPSKKTVITHHGRGENIIGNSNVVLIPAFLAGGDVNVIGVDWGLGSSMVTEVLMNNTLRSGQHVAQFIKWLSATSGQPIEEFLLVGFSIGAHQCGITARNLDGRATYVVALDPPSYPEFEHQFTPDAGRYTEMIYTSINEARGLHHFAQNTFFVNGGTSQPACTPATTCNHLIANNYFAETLISGGFTSRECETADDARVGSCGLLGTLQMGGWNPKEGTLGTGYFYLETNAIPPYSKG